MRGKGSRKSAGDGREKRAQTGTEKGERGQARNAAEGEEEKRTQTGAGRGKRGQARNAAEGEEEKRTQQVVLCGANAYEEKYWLNPLFGKIPESMKEELRAICVLFTQEAGGVFMLVFDEEGKLEGEAFADEEDITYDRVSAGLLTGEVRRRRADMFRTLELYYRICVLHEDAASVLTEADEE